MYPDLYTLQIFYYSACVGYDCMIPMLLVGKVDVCGTCLSITEERLKYIDMVENYRSKVQAVVCIPEIDTK